MASNDLKSNSSNELFKTQVDELGQMKLDVEQLKNEFIMAQTKYHQRLSDYEAKFEQLHCQVEKVQQEQEEKETNLLNATAEWRDIKSRLESSVMSPNQKVKLNVGGRYFQTTMETLTKYSEGTMSYFKVLFSRQWQLELDPKDESIFIDRDGILFEFILQYLRTGIVPIDLNDSLLRRDLIIEVQFYKLDTLINLLNTGSLKKVHFSKPNASNDSKQLYADTKILSSNDQSVLNKLSGFDNQQWQLIYRASRDGYTAEAFHQSCDGYFPTICVIRSTDGFIFGGFASIPWSSTNEEKRDASAFLFTLKNPHGIKPTKYPVLERAVDFAINHKFCEGPTFGSGPRGGVDLSLRSPFNIQENRTFFPQSYKDTTKIGRLTFTGDAYFACNDVEIFTLTQQK